jgi:hypothetical protein
MLDEVDACMCQVDIDVDQAAPARATIQLEFITFDLHGSNEILIEYVRWPWAERPYGDIEGGLSGKVAEVGQTELCFGEIYVLRNIISKAHFFALR